MRLFDSHCHLNMKHFKDDWREVYEKAKKAGIYRMVVVGWDLSSSERAVKMVEGMDGAYAACGFHPHDAKLFREEDILNLKRLLSHPKVVALGETGLDYYYDNSPREIQRKVFEAQLSLAKEVNKPVIIHVRDAHEDAFSIIENVGLPEGGGVLHCYTGGTKYLEKGLSLGLYVSFSGIITFPNADDLRKAASLVPLERVLIETDSPYLAPRPHRGERNEPSYLLYVLEEVARARGENKERLAFLTYENANKFFRIK
ncbi:MAG: TatD family hydrolase [Synergistetes bacterium]|nr:TatD family hydrolase [Synergistota bacterium]MCX8127537.1 TatD family hydrolase [Synergistota bacterium]MDW8191546.1 TatD family hydrolase [Synergistota bacterium]